MNFDPQRRMEAFGTNQQYLPDNSARITRNFLIAWLVGTTVQRHWEATGDWEIAAKAGVRALGRWYVFCAAFGLHIILFFIQAATPLAMMAMKDRPADVVVMFVTWIAVWFSFPFGLGVMWVRFADRSLFQVNRNFIYRALLPFAVIARHLPDAALFFMPTLTWILGLQLGGAIASNFS